MTRAGMAINATLICCTVLVPVAHAQGGLEYRALTDRTVYDLGETVVATLQVCNGGDTVAQYDVDPCAPTDLFQVYDQAGTTLVAYADFGPWCSPAIPPQDLAPGGCEVLATWSWPQLTGGSPDGPDGDPVGAGHYTMAANYLGQSTEMVPFEIRAPEQMVGVPLLGGVGLALLAIAIGVSGLLLAGRPRGL